MNVFMEILILWIITYRAGQCDPRKTIVPTMIEDHQERTYKCQFNEKVDCLWQRNGITIKITPYKYVEGNGINTQDCSIVANISHPKLKVEECIGLIKSTVIPKEISGGSTQLNCSSQTEIHCSWRRNRGVVNVDNIKYKYIGQHNGNDTNDCSITIANTTAIDNGTWDCLGKITSEMNSDATLIATYDLQWTPTSTTEAKTTPPNTGEKKSSSKADNSKGTSTSEKGRGKEKRMVAYLSSACAVIVVLIGVIIYLRKRQITNRRISKKYSEQQLDVENKAASDNEVAEKDPENEEHTYGNIPKSHATPSALEYKREQPSLTQQFGQPDADKRSTEIVYTEVVISLRNPVNSTNSLPISTIEKTTYATILPKTITEEIPEQ